MEEKRVLVVDRESEGKSVTVIVKQENNNGRKEPEYWDDGWTGTQERNNGDAGDKQTGNGKNEEGRRNDKDARRTGACESVKVR